MAGQGPGARAPSCRDALPARLGHAGRRAADGEVGSDSHGCRHPTRQGILLATCARCPAADRADRAPRQCPAGAALDQGARQETRSPLEEVRRDALGQKLDAEQTAGLLEALARSGWVRELKAVSTPKGGRPARRWQVNPNSIPHCGNCGNCANPPPPGGFRS